MRLGEEYVKNVLNKGEEEIKHAIFFRHGKSGSNFAVKKRVKPFLLLCRRTIPSQDLCNMYISGNVTS